MWIRKSVLGWGLLAGCGAAPTPVAPLSLPPTFSEVGSAQPAARWWQAMGEPALDALVEEALRANLSLQAARHRIAQAAAVARRAGAELGPTLDASVGATLAVPAQRGAAVAFPLGVSARYELDLFGRVEALEEAARLDVQVSEASAQAAALALAGQVASIFYLHGERLGQVRLIEAQTVLNRQVLELVELRFSHGKAGAQDVLRQRQLVESAEGELARLRAEAAVLRHQLAVLCGRTPGGEGPPEPTGDLPPLASAVPTEVIQRRPDMVAARLRVVAADQRVAAALADRFPRLSLSAGASSPDVREIMDNWVLNLGANLVAPLLDAGRRAAEVDRTRAVVDEAVALYGQAALEALAEVENALARGRHQQALIESLDRQLELARGAVERARDRYGAGAASYVEVLDALRTLQALERTRLTARRESFQHRVDLFRALAGGLPPAGETLPRPNRQGNQDE